MLWIYNEGKITLDTVSSALNDIFFSYPDVADSLINRVISDTEKEEDLEFFFDSIANVNEENIKWNVSASEEKLLIESFRALLGNYDSMKTQKLNISEMKIQEEMEKNNISEDNLNVIF